MLNLIQQYFRSFSIRSRRFLITDDGDEEGLCYQEKISHKQLLKEKEKNSPGLSTYKSLYLKKISLSSIRQSIDTRSKRIKRWAAAASILCAVFSLSVLIVSLSLVLALGITLSVSSLLFVFLSRYLHRNNSFIFLKYRLEGRGKVYYEDFIQKVRGLHYSDAFWHIDEMLPNSNLKDHGGSEVLYNRSSVRIILATPYFIYSNIDILCLRYKDSTCYFFPDFVLLENNNAIHTLPYEDLLIRYVEKPYCETGPVPEDAVVLDYRWLHPKKDGTADKRFKSNRKVPVILYGEVTISSYRGMNFTLQVSHLQVIQAFSRFIGRMSSHYAETLFNVKTERPEDDKAEREKEKKTSAGDAFRDGADSEDRSSNEKTEREKPPGRLSPELQACEVLGVGHNAGQQEIKRAYRILVKQYHPDRFAGRDPDYISEAEEKIKEINRAYEELKLRDKQPSETDRNSSGN